jgi:hypothetical protein
MNKALPSAEHPIASQESAPAVAAKAAHAKLRKRPEDDVVADPTAAAPSDQAVAATDENAAAPDQEVLVAQAAPAADAAASAGGAAPAAAAAEGSASAGAGAPVVGAAAGGGGIGIGALALGGGAVAVAAAAGGGGGGGGGGGTSAAPAPMTPAPGPAPMPSMLIHGFSDFMAAINQGGATAATNVTAGVTSGPPPASIVDISGGFSRGVLPKMIADLRPLSYNVSGASASSINDGGIAVDLQGNPTGDAHINAHSNAGAGMSNLMWMQTMAVRDAASHGQTVATAAAIAAGRGGDAEIGIQHVSMDFAGSGAINARTDLTATATDGASAHALAGDVNLHMASSATGTSAAPVAAEIHMGFGEGTEPGMLASASGTGSSANVGVTGNVSLGVHGDDAYAFSSGVFAHGTSGGSAHTDIGGNLSFAADGRAAHTYALVDASSDAAAGSVGDVHIHGSVDLNSTGTQEALTRAAVRADGGGTVEIDGHLSVDSNGPTANSFMQLIAQGGTGEISAGSVDMNINGGGHGWMDLYTDHSGGLSIGAANLVASAGSDISLHVQNANAPTSGAVDTTFLGHGDGTANVSIATANVGGAGEIHMFLNSQTFGTINQAASVARLDLHYQLADQDSAGVGSAQMTTINGYSASHDEVTYNGVLANATNFTNAGSFSSLDALNAGLNTALDGTHKYVFAVYTGTEDINHNGIADDHNAGIVAFDDNGTGITSVLMLPGVTALTASDLAWPAPPPPPTPA